MEWSSLIDMPLDDIIELNNPSRKRSRPSAPQPFLGSSGPVRPVSHFPAPTAPYTYRGPPTVPPMLLQAPLSGWDPGEGTKLYVSNLDYGVSNEDIKGTAEVVFFRPKDAIVAIRRYNNSRLDGKPLMIDLVGANVIAPNYYCIEPCGATPLGGQRPLMTTQGHDRNIGRGPSQGGNGWRRFENVKPTTEALNADLERYQLKAKKAFKFAEGS